MNKFKRGIGFLACLISTPAVALRPSVCDETAQGQFDIYNDIGPIVGKQYQYDGLLKKGAILVDEERVIVKYWSKPEGGIGSVVPFKRPQLFFSRFLIDGQERNCSTQRHEDVFGAGEMRRQYHLRCLLDLNGDGQFEHFHRYGELVPYDFRSGTNGVPTGEPQTDQPVVQPIALVATDAPPLIAIGFNPAVRSFIKVVDVNKTEVTLRFISQVTILSLSSNKNPINDNYPYVDIVVKLVDGGQTLIGKTNLYVSGSPSAWKLSFPNGFVSDARLICGGTMLETKEMVAVFKGGGVQQMRRGVPEE